MGLGKYIKRGFRYVLYDSKPKTIFVRPSVSDASEIFKDKVVLVTGGGSGIGLSIAKSFDNAGAFVIITGRNEEKLKSAIKEMKNAIYYKNDISDIKKQDDLLEFIYKKFEKIDILINNAGVSHHEDDFLTVTEKDFDMQFDTNLKGAYFLAQKCIKRVENDPNLNLNIIFVSSERGDQCDYLPYGLTKVAIDSLVEGLSCRFIRKGIRVNAVAPGVTVSNFNTLNKNDNLQTNRFIGERFFVPEEVAETVLFLASDYSMCISGEIVHCNNGNHLNAWFEPKK